MLHSPIPSLPTSPALKRGAPAPGWQACYVRLRGHLLRKTTIKVFYHDTALVQSFVDRMRNLGQVQQIDFPDPAEVVDSIQLAQTRNEFPDRVIYGPKLTNR